MQDFTLLQGARSHRSTAIKNNIMEIDAGLKIHGYEEFDVPFENENKRIERIISYSNEKLVLVFYVGIEEVVSMKVFDLTKGLTKTTTVFPSLSIGDLPSIIKLLNR